MIIVEYEPPKKLGKLSILMNYLKLNSNYLIIYVDFYVLYMVYWKYGKSKIHNKRERAWMKLDIQNVTMSELIEDEERKQLVKNGLMNWFDALECDFQDEFIQADESAESLIEELEYNEMGKEKIIQLHQATGYARYGGYIDLYYVSDYGFYVMVAFLPRTW